MELTRHFRNEERILVLLDLLNELREILECLIGSQMQEILIHSHSFSNRLDLFEEQFISCSIDLGDRKRVSFILRRLIIRKRGSDFHCCLFFLFYVIMD